MSFCADKAEPTGEPGRSSAFAVAWLMPLAGLLLLQTACRREQVQVYQVPKDAPGASAQPVDPHAGLNMSVAGLGQMPEMSRPALTWQLPAGWQELPASQMRVGHFAISDDGDRKAQLTIIPLAGTGGGDAENVNRWRGQVSLPRLSAEEITQQSEPVEIAGASGRLWNFLGETPDENKQTRLMAGILHREGTAWFFKLSGDDSLVTAQKPAFVQFLKTLKFGEASPAGAPATSAKPDPPAASVVAAPGVAPEAPKFDAPANWQAQAPGPMQLAKYVPAGAEGKAEITIVVLPGDGGGKLANINRWRRQLGVGPIAEDGLAAITVPLKAAGESYAVDFKDDAGKRRMIAAAVASGGQSWFYKLTGDDAVVEREKPAFVKFVESTRHAP